MSEPLPLVFIHGWGLNSTIWEPVITNLGTQQCHTIDLGFVGGGTTSWTDLAKPAIYVGHSFGVFWCLSNKALNIKALVSINGFACFHAFTPKEKIIAMQEGLAKNAGAQMAQFWRRAGFDRFAASDQLNQHALHKGLDRLLNEDASNHLARRQYPLKILASHDDRIVPPSAAVSCWTEQPITWHNAATHALPLDDPSWCANEIKSYLKTLS